MPFLERGILKEKKSNTALRGNDTFAGIITFVKINLIVIFKITQGVQAVFIILALKVL